VKKDELTAIELYQKACYLNFAIACESYTQLKREISSEK